MPISLIQISLIQTKYNTILELMHHFCSEIYETDSKNASPLVADKKSFTPCSEVKQVIYIYKNIKKSSPLTHPHEMKISTWL